MKERNICEKMILFVYEETVKGVSATDRIDIMNEFSNYSRGYAYDRLQVLIDQGYLDKAKIPGEYLYLTRKGRDWVRRLKEEEQ